MKRKSVRLIKTYVTTLGIAALTFGASSAFAASSQSTHHGLSDLLFVVQIMALMLVGRLLGEAMLRIKQPAVIGQLLAGLILGPSVFGLLLPDVQKILFPSSPEQKAMIDAISQFGVLLLLLLTGMEMDLKLVRQSGRPALFASLMGVIVPFALGVLLGLYLPDSLLADPQKRLITSLFLGTALSIASVKIVAMVVREMNFTRRLLGQVILTSAIIDDSIGWILVSIIFSLAAYGGVEAWPLARSIIGTLLFLVVSLTVGRRTVFFIIRWVNDTFISEFAVVTAILLIMGVMSLITYAIGIHMVLGAFVAGILIGESPILTKHIDEQLRGLITAFFAPIFFGIAGLSTDLTILATPKILLLTLGIILIASMGKFGGAFIGGELGGLTRREGFALACGMNARGSTEVIIASLGLSTGALSHDLFTMIVMMAVVTTMAMPPSLRFALSRIPMRKEEKQRLEREEMDKKGFVPNLERLLVAIDDSANGKFATRMAGMLADIRGIPATVLHISDPEKIDAKKQKDAKISARRDNGKNEKPPAKDMETIDKKAREASDTVQQSAEQIKTKQPEEEKTYLPVTITTISHKAPDAEFIAAEARKGYNLLVIGLEKTSHRNGEFHDRLTSLASGFTGSLAITDVRGSLLKQPDTKLNILIPVNGTEPARRAAEVAITIARATKAPLTVLYVAVRASGKRNLRQGIRRRQHEEAILRDIVTIADGYNMSVRTAVLSNAAADEAILGEAKRRKNNLIVLGVGRRPGEKLFFGETATSLLKNAESSLLLVAT